MDIYKTLLFGLKLTVMGIDELQPYIFMPYPGSEIFNDINKQGKITLNDDYFLTLTCLNSDLTNLKPLSFNGYVGSTELAIYRLFFTMMAYGLGYLLYPSRIIRTIRNLSSQENAGTVFEHRLKDLFKRNKKESVQTQ
jgi:radical SAM superfamily enzyme YgiQ (UPF0313 family)